ncbi:alpha/beta hydrolase [Roseibium denhamense]|uniref:Lysophospholipase n=1 Tax=Roseibium denhamense TaxID=76305 RepID=A0ABY1NKU1_9HYPH|nr:alpha/beta hydrolase [Roseibium denhamense]MTI06834.1 alpha/beta hydrolase [Roseibium denhamense]SMP11841.1 lysophospholipase [Roseibium denhamense]
MSLLISIPENPVPDGAKSGVIVTPDKVRLRFAHWPATGSRRLGTVTLLQGRSEFIEKYFEIISDLRERGFNVVTFDWRGQGGSQRMTRNPKRGHIRSFAKFRLDLRTILKEVSLATYSGPHFAVAHSTGALVLLSDTERLRTMLDRAILTAPLLGLANSGKGFSIKRFLVSVLSLGLIRKKPPRSASARKPPLAETIGFPLAYFAALIGLGRLFVPGGNSQILVPFHTNRQTSDQARFDRFNKVLDVAPDLGIGSPTLGWLNAAARAMKNLRLRNAGPNVRLPCLVLAAGNDRIVSTPMIEDFVSRTKAATYIEIPGAEHELMMERDVFRDQFWAAFDAFLPGFEAEQDLARRAGAE